MSFGDQQSLIITRIKQFLPVVLICIVLTSVTYMFIFAGRVEDVIDKIRENGGAVQTRCILPNWSQNYTTGWIEKKFQRPYAIWLPPSYGDEELKEILKVSDLISLTASGTRITEKSLSLLAQYKGLELLYLSRNTLDVNKIEWLEKQLPATSIIY